MKPSYHSVRRLVLVWRPYGVVIIVRFCLLKVFMYVCMYVCMYVYADIIVFKVILFKLFH